MNKRVRSALAAGLTAAAGLFAYAAAVEPYAIGLVEFEMLCPRLPRSLDGLKILQISDIHMRKFGRRERRIEKIARSVDADIVALTGDMVHSPEGIEPFLRLAQSFRSRLGTYAVYGNSEHKNGIRPARLTDVLAQRGINPLVNRGLRVASGSASIYVCGVDDPTTYHDELARALADARPDEFILLLMHSADNASEAAYFGVDVILSGHTHGGQVRIPLLDTLVATSIHGAGLASGYYGGRSLRRLIGANPGRTQLYISRGVGISGLALRFLCPPEITLLTLRAL